MAADDGSLEAFVDNHRAIVESLLASHVTPELVAGVESN